MPMSALTGTRLRERRMALGLRQAELALAAAISPSYLNLIEHNRRNVTPDILRKLAEALGVDATALAEGSGGALREDLRSAAAAVPAAGAELDRLEEFAGRYPGWAAVLAALQSRNGTLERAVAALNDRMTHDPHLSAALHEVLSSLSSVRATASILAETEDLSPDWQARFHRNIYEDSQRLALGAEALVAYLDGSKAEAEQGIAAPQEELEEWLAARGWHLPEIEAGDAGALEADVAQLASSAARSLAQAHLQRSARDAALLPLAAFQQAVADLGSDPARIAAHFGCDVLTVMRRTALLPGSDAGLVSCDASGTLVFRKPARGFALPRFGAACPLWPLYAALARPMTPVQSQVEMAGPSGGRFQVLAFCQTRLPGGFEGPELREATMLILPATGPRGAVQLLVGSSCRVCPRADCLARREPSITREGL